MAAISSKQEQRRHHNSTYTVPFNTRATIKTFLNSTNMWLPFLVRNIRASKCFKKSQNFTTFSCKQNVKVLFYYYLPFSGVIYLNFIHIRSHAVFYNVNEHLIITNTQMPDKNEKSDQTKEHYYLLKTIYIYIHINYWLLTKNKV